MASSASCGLSVWVAWPLAIATLRRHKATIPIRRVVRLNPNTLPDRSARAVDKAALGVRVTNDGFAVPGNRIDKCERCAFQPYLSLDNNFISGLESGSTHNSSQHCRRGRLLGQPI